MQPIRKPTWQQATALVSLSTCGAMTGFAFAHGSVDDMTSPTRMPVHLVAVSEPERPAAAADSTLRSAIVDVANKYMQLARNKTPAEMEALIWGSDSVDGADHGESCAAFASLTLELGARAAGQQSWVTGGTSYPWPLHQWADVRVDPNSDSLNVISVLQDAQAHSRWHPLGDGYHPQPGDWVLFDGHVEVVTAYSDGVLDTIGGDSLPNFSVNAHQYSGSLGADGVAGFVNNGELLSVVSKQPGSVASKSSSAGEQVHKQAKASVASSGAAQIPGLQTAMAMTGTGSSTGQRPSAGSKSSPSVAKPAVAATTTGSLAAQNSVGTASTVTMPGTLPGTGTASHPVQTRTRATQHGQTEASAAIPGVSVDTVSSTAASSPRPKSATSSPTYTKNNVPSLAQTPGTAAQHAFISQIAPGAMAAQSRYGVPAAVTIAQAIDESGWGQSELAARDNNLFGIKGTGPAGTDMMPTREFVNGRYVTQTSGFRVYRNIAESISDHAQLLATGSSYTRAMANRQLPDAFANDLTGVYATDPTYGSSLIQIMQLYNLYRYDAATVHSPTAQSSTAQGPAAHDSAAPSSGTHNSASTAPAAKSSQTHGQGSQVSGGQISGGQGSAQLGSANAPTVSSPITTPLGGTAAVAAPNEGVLSQPEAGVHSAASPAPTASSSAAPAGSGSASGSTASRASASRASASRASASRASASRASASRGSASRGTASRGTATGPKPSARSGKSSVNAASTGRAASGNSGGSNAQTRGRSSNSAQGTISGAGGSGSSGNSPGLGGSAGQRGGTSTIPGVLDAHIVPQASAKTQVSAKAGPSRLAPPIRPARVSPRPQASSTTLYKAQIPQVVTTAYISAAKAPLIRAQPLYEDVASNSGIRWELLAACDWMQCQAQPRYSPVHGEKLGSKAGGMAFHTKSEALAQCASDLVELAMAVYWIDITARRRLSVRDLAQVFAAFRWGGLLKLHDISALEFPYSVAGLTSQHLKMRWPDVKEPNAPDKPGSRFRMPFGAVPVVLSLGYRAVT
jgi:flagellum-specific peptidoglycan hydrolase FlgJ